MVSLMSFRVGFFLLNLSYLFFVFLLFVCAFLCIQRQQIRGYHHRICIRRSWFFFSYLIRERDVCVCVFFISLISNTGAVCFVFHQGNWDFGIQFEFQNLRVVNQSYSMAYQNYVDFWLVSVFFRARFKIKHFFCY